MVRTVTQFFKKYITSSPENPDRVSEHSLQIATAALLVEMLRADSEVREEERKAITEIMRSKFNLSEEEIGGMLKFAEEEVRRATGYFEFTSLINKGLAYDQKVSIIEHLWEVSFSDAAVDKHEEHMVRKIAGLIHVDHKDFIEAKLRVRKRLPGK
ncbi:MAG: TerB family tellurite resistance protein [Nitrospiraceae bacterium]|nr:MAG: TerB family tellurite resistance protein [Nitrospiraceae bacterium]